MYGEVISSPFFTSGRAAVKVSSLGCSDAIFAPVFQRFEAQASAGGVAELPSGAAAGAEQVGEPAKENAAETERFRLALSHEMHLPSLAAVYASQNLSTWGGGRSPNLPQPDKPLSGYCPTP